MFVRYWGLAPARTKKRVIAVSGSIDQRIHGTWRPACAARWLATAAALLAATAPVVPGAAAVTVQQVEEGIRTYMNRKFKNCIDLKIEVVPYEDASRLQKGQVQSIVITVKRADKSGIIMNDLYLKGTDVEISLHALFELRKLRTKSRKPASIRAMIKEGELNEAFGKMKDFPIQEFTLKFENGTIVCTGVYRFIFGNRLKMIAELVPVKSKTDPEKDGIHLVARHAWVNGLPLPVGQVNALLANMNPIIDFADIPFSPEVKKVVVGKDTLTISS
jgi:hypothetical protein